VTAVARLVLVVVSLAAVAAPARAQCRRSEILVDEDENNYYCATKDDDQIHDAKSIRSAIARGQRPPFAPLWDHYQYNRDIAKGLAPDQNRCAIVLSMTLGLRPRAGEASLRDLGGHGALSILTQIRHRLVIPEVAGAELATRYYVQAQQLANRLRDELGAPEVLRGTDARQRIAGRRGIVFLQDAYRDGGTLGRRTGDHIDIWDGGRIGAFDVTTTPFDQAAQVWFWETQR